MKLLIATQNPGKVREYQHLLADLPLEILGLRDVGLADMDVDENGDSFEANALIKAQAYAEAAGVMALADDSGLVVDALDGQPGIYSARYGGPGLDNAGRRALLLQEMASVPDPERTARFMCVIAVVDPHEAQVITAEGRCEGMITTTERDLGKGFGYDALFQPEGHALTFGEMADEQKDTISHRGLAVQALIPRLRDIIQP